MLTLMMIAIAGLAIAFILMIIFSSFKEDSDRVKANRYLARKYDEENN